MVTSTLTQMLLGATGAIALITLVCLLVFHPRRPRKPHPGLFVVLESDEEGAGKTTLARTLLEELRNLGHDVLLTREPGGTAWAEAMRSSLLDPNIDRTGNAALFAMNSARADLVETVIRPALDSGYVVLCDRFTMSSLAYQGEAMGLGFEHVRGVCELATRGLHPDLTLFLTLSPEAAAERRMAAGRTGDFFEKDAFAAKARAGYARAVREDPSVRQIRADQNKEDVVRDALRTLSPHLPVPSRT